MSHASAEIIHNSSVIGHSCLVHRVTRQLTAWNDETETGRIDGHPTEKYLPLYAPR